jgi:hypothetical protein
LTPLALQGVFCFAQASETTSARPVSAKSSAKLNQAKARQKE